MNDLAKELRTANGKPSDMYLKKEKKSQLEIVKEWLTRNGSITPRVAWRMLGVYRLSSIINRLRKRGYNIETEMQHEGDDQFAKYKLISTSQN